MQACTNRAGPPDERLAESTSTIFWGLKGPGNGQASHGPRRAVRDSLGNGGERPHDLGVTIGEQGTERRRESGVSGTTALS